MSEPMFPAPEPQVAEAPAPPTERSGSNRTVLLALGGVLGAVIVGGGAFLLLSGGSDQPAAVSAAPAAPSAPHGVRVAERDTEAGHAPGHHVGGHA